MAKKNGRPTKWNEDWPRQLIEYFETEIGKGNLPFLSKFARNIMGVCNDTALEYTKKYEDFSDAYKKAKDMQKEFIIEMGLSKKWDTAFTIFTAQNMTDMRNKQEVTGENGNAIIIKWQK